MDRPTFLRNDSVKAAKSNAAAFINRARSHSLDPIYGQSGLRTLP